MEFDFEIRHIPGKSNSRADALSKRPDYDMGTHDNENIIVLPESVFVRAVTIASPEEGQDEETLRPWIDPHKLKCVHNVWYKEGRRVVTRSMENKRTIIKSRHDPAIYGHPGIMLRYCRNVRPTWVKFDSKDTKESRRGFEV